MKGIILTFLFSFCIFMYVFAQEEAGQKKHKCYTDEMQHHMHEQFPELKEEYDKLQQVYKEWDKEKFDAKSGEILTIPVVVHVVWSESNPASNISDEQIYSQMEALNKAFRRTHSDTSETRDIFKSIAADIEIEFCLASVDPDGNPTLGITRTKTDIDRFDVCDSEEGITYPTGCEFMKFDSKGGKDAWDSRKYLNVWVVNALSDLVLGYAMLPQGAPRSIDGFVAVHYAFGTTGTVVEEYSGGATSVHEIGHWLGLGHPWGPLPARDPDNSCDLDDNISDTPTTRKENFFCNFTINSCFSSQEGDLPDMVENYMDYSDDRCANMFTLGQKNRMRRTLTGNGYRASVAENTAACELELTAYNPLLSNLVSPSDDEANCALIDPVIEITNLGTEPLNAVDIIYSLRGSDEVYTYSWNSETAIEAFKRTEVTLPQMAVTADAKQVKTSSNGAIYELITNLKNPITEEVSDTFTYEFSIKKTGYKKIVTEDFEGALFPPLFWTQNEREKFIKNEEVSFGEGQNSLYINNFEYENAVDNVDHLTLREMDLSTSGDTVFTFHYAYAQRNENEVPDELSIIITSNCEASWDTIFQSAGSDLATTAAVADSAFIPTLADWREVNIDLAPYSYGRNTLIRFIQKRGEGNNLYIDNINLLPAFFVGTQSPTINTSNIRVYPNPAKDITQISFEATIKQSTALKVYDKTGRLVLQQPIDTQVGNNTYLIDTKELPTGMYFIQLGEGTLQQQQKLLIVK